MLSTTKRTRSMVVVAVLMGAILLTAPAVAASSVIVTNQTINGSMVKVTVKNTSFLPVTTVVMVQVQVGGMTTWGTAPVVLLGGQSASVGVGFTGTVTKVLCVGINDEYVPY